MTKPAYPLVNYLSFEKFSPSHKTFLTSLNTISIHSFVSKTLINETSKYKGDENIERYKVWLVAK